MQYQSIQLERYLEQKARWPKQGRHIMAQYDESSIIVYQAYRPAIGLYAIEHQYFAGEFSLNRMSWIKPNFLWMMYRSNWARTPGQEVVLGIRLQRSFFDKVVALAVPSSFDSALYPTQADWKKAVGRSEVRLQWDPDHAPSGGKLERRAIQLGLRGKILEEYSREAIIEIIDVSALAHQYSPYAIKPYEGLYTPLENVYPGS